jgi:hypothetical protein
VSKSVSRTMTQFQQSQSDYSRKSRSQELYWPERERVSCYQNLCCVNKTSFIVLEDAGAADVPSRPPKMIVRISESENIVAGVFCG